MKNKNQKGSILYFAVLLLGILFSAGITVTTVLIQRIGMIEEMSYSTAAFYAADAGIEKILYRWDDVATESNGDVVNWGFNFENHLLEGQSYRLRKDDQSEGLILVSVGSFSPSEGAVVIRRGIQISLPVENNE